MSATIHHDRPYAPQAAEFRRRAETYEGLARATRLFTLISPSGKADEIRDEYQSRALTLRARARQCDDLAAVHT